ncbi:unnamed protein product [Ceutorhynchus assimilis]|uniref:Uncharacterized protein n=1 Tax=Ceutorhynchus assimilis TaxID=467358 RepID=A0A9N9MKN5_9CUCU|nr:unnamed protein product [Ceutorhynchus assimilis]
MKAALAVVFVVLAVQLAVAKPLDGTDDGKSKQKRSLYTDRSFDLTGMERINKRSVDDMDNAESGVYFLPSFARRSRRSVDDDMDKAESGVYFLPSFARRSRRSVDDNDMEKAESGVYFLPSFARRQRRSADDMENAESGVYFLPSFARRN